MMTDFELSTKELVRTYTYSDIHFNREDNKFSIVKGRTVCEFGTRTATTLVGNLYAISGSGVESIKYLLLVGVARQNPYKCSPVYEKQAEELAAFNARINPVLTLITEEIPSDDAFADLGAVMTESSLLKKKFILTDEEKNTLPA